MNFKTQSTLATFLVLMHGRFSRTNMQKKTHAYEIVKHEKIWQNTIFSKPKTSREMFTCRPVHPVNHFWRILNLRSVYLYVCLTVACLGVVGCKIFKNNKQRSSFIRKTRVVVHSFKIKVGVVGFAKAQ